MMMDRASGNLFLFSAYFLTDRYSRITPYEWDNPHPCKANPDELETQFTMTNALWFGMGSFLCQGSDILPK